MRKWTCLTAFLCLVCVAAVADAPLRPVNTYSIVARDVKTGELGVAVQSHWFAVGAGVAWAEPGVGAVATQSFVDPAYGPLGLQLMRAGKDASQALSALLLIDDDADVRQVGMVDANGVVANHTGDMAIIEYCDIVGDGFAVQANLMWKPTVCEAMVAAYESADGDLGERLMVALEAGENEGGDIRGKQSPLQELRRLMTINRAYNLMNMGDEYFVEGSIERAVEAYSAAGALVPDSHEVIFWHAVTLAGAGDVQKALPLFKRAFVMWPKWRELVPRLPASELLPDDPDLIAEILSTD
jgi:tetratricopeptide (TPR) repeat protein